MKKIKIPRIIQKTDKAYRIYEETKMECRRHIEKWGYDPETDGGWSGGMLSPSNPKNGELIYRRTMNVFEKLLESDKKHLETDSKLNILTKEQKTLKENTLIMLERTMKNQYIC